MFTNLEISTLFDLILLDLYCMLRGAYTKAFLLDEFLILKVYVFALCQVAGSFQFGIRHLISIGYFVIDYSVL